MTSENLSLYDFNYENVNSGDEWDSFPQVQEQNDLELLVDEYVLYLDKQEVATKS